MPRTTKPHLEWRARAPSAAFASVLRRRLNRISPWIADSWGTHDPTELDALLGELVRNLEICWLYLGGTDRSASVAQRRVNLKALIDRADFSAAALARLDPATWSSIAHRCPGGPFQAIQRDLSPSIIEEAARAALVALGAPKRGRSKDSGSLARRQFALFLGRSYRSASGKNPTRIVKQVNDVNSTANSEEAGTFREFCLRFWQLVPFCLRPEPTLDSERIDYLVRVAIDEFALSEKEATMINAKGERIVTNPTRLWNIEGSLWLGKSPGNNSPLPS